MKQLIIIATVVISTALLGQTETAQKIKDTKHTQTPASSPKKELDKQAIKSMAGIYKVNFDFAETFSEDTAYNYHKRYKEWGIEYVFVAEENENKIALQHLLIVNDTTIIKHWRQDWVFENKDIYHYYKDNEWIKKTLTTEQAQGKWTQKVYQVDDSPRYESYGTWVHVDGKHFWEGVNDSPLPRREVTTRSDYNVMRRHSRMEILTDGWVLNQDNEKILRANGIDKTICWEKGIEKFTKGNYDATPATKWWNKQVNYWADVRKVWDEVYTTNPALKIEKKISNKMLYEALFELGDNHCNQTNYVQGTAIEDIKKVISSYIKS
jgi:hypothetical protein